MPTHEAALLDPGEVVSAFMAAQASRDAEFASQYLSPDVVLEIVPIPPPAGVARGADDVCRHMRDYMLAATKVEWTVHRQLVVGDLVMHERTDAFWYTPGVFPGADYYANPVAGVFEVRNGLIELWRDYCDVGVIEQTLGVDLVEYSRIAHELSMKG